jgi:hypothetical protein
LIKAAISFTPCLAQKSKAKLRYEAALTRKCVLHIRIQGRVKQRMPDSDPTYGVCV